MTGPEGNNEFCFPRISWHTLGVLFKISDESPLGTWSLMGQKVACRLCHVKPRIFLDSVRLKDRVFFLFCSFLRCPSLSPTQHEKDGPILLRESRDSLVFFCRILVAEGGLVKWCHSDGVVHRLTTAAIKAGVVNTVLQAGSFIFSRSYV